MRPIFCFLCLLIFSQIQPLAASERELHCRVVGISDGDTLTCLSPDRKPLKVRLQHIDAPESSQPFGNRAKQMLATLAYKRQVKLLISGYDKYGRMLAVVYDGSQNLNLALVEKGMAWAYRQTQPIYEQAQMYAKMQRIGLWQDSSAINPSEWRKMKGIGYHNQQMQAVKNPQTFTNATNCQQKLSCRHFNTFDEANRYFQQCNAKSMDGNGDGIPCNSLYRKTKQTQK